MNSLRKPIVQKPRIGTTLPSTRRDEGNWNMIAKSFKEEVERLKEENVNLQASRALFVESWQSVLKKMEFLADENRSSNEALHTLLNEERQKAENCSKENESLSKRLKESEEACAVQKQEIQRLTEAFEGEKKSAEVYVASCEEQFRLKSFEFEVEMQLRDKQLEELHCELSERTQRHAEGIELVKESFEAERLQWAKLREEYETEVCELRAQVSKLECFSHESHRSANGAVTAETEKISLIPSDDVIADNVNQNVIKKSRLEAARKRRRQKEHVSDVKTIISLNKLRDLKENFCV